MTRGPQLRWLKTLLITGSALFALSPFLEAPLDSGGTLVEATCQWTMTVEEARLIWDVRHIGFFAILALVAWSLSARARFGIVTFGLVGYAVALELSQSIFSRGHCRIWDVLADLVGMLIALVIVALIRTFRARRQPAP